MTGTGATPHREPTASDAAYRAFAQALGLHHHDLSDADMEAIDAALEAAAAAEADRWTVSNAEVAAAYDVLLDSPRTPTMEDVRAALEAAAELGERSVAAHRRQEDDR